MTTNTYSRPTLGPSTIVAICDAEADTASLREVLGLSTITAAQIPTTIIDPNAMVVVLSAVDAHAKANALIESGMSRLRVGFVDLSQMAGFAGFETVSQFVESNPDHLLGLIERPSDPVLHMTVRPLPDWGDRPTPEMFPCGDAVLADHIRWEMGTVAIWTGGYGSGKSTVACQMAFKKLLTPEATDADFGASFCCFEDDLLDMRDRCSNHFFKGDFDEARAVDLVNFQRRLWWYDERLPRPKGLDQWMQQVEQMTLRHGVRVHVLDPWTAHIPELEKSEQATAYVNRMMNEIQQLAQKLKIVVHIITHVPKDKNFRFGKPKPIAVNDAFGSGDFGKFAHYGFAVTRTGYVARMLNNIVSDDDIDYGQVRELTKGQLKIETAEHLVLYVDKVKREGSMGGRGLFAFAIDKGREDIVLDPAATTIIRKLWGM